MFWSSKLSELGEIDDVKVLAWKSGGVKFWTNLMSALLNNVKLLDLSTLLHRFVKVVKWISQSCYMYFCLSQAEQNWRFAKIMWKWIVGVVKDVIWICLTCNTWAGCQICHIYFSRFTKQNQADVWPRFWDLLIGLKNLKV